MAMAFAAMCGTSAPDPDDAPTCTGFSCNDYNLMIKVEMLIGDDCTVDTECDQIVSVDDSCPAANRVLNASFDAEYLFDLIEEAEGEGCTVDYRSEPGDCDPDAVPVCNAGNCGWL